jgi:hypothetical protein
MFQGADKHGMSMVPPDCCPQKHSCYLNIGYLDIGYLNIGYLDIGYLNSDFLSSSIERQAEGWGRQSQGWLTVR